MMAVPVASSSANQNQIAAAKPLGVHISAEKHTLDEFRVTCVRLADQHEIRQPFVDRALDDRRHLFLGVERTQVVSRCVFGDVARGDASR